MSLVVLACENIDLYALCVSSVVKAQGFVWKFLCAIYKVPFIHSFIYLGDKYARIVLLPAQNHILIKTCRMSMFELRDY